MMEKYNNFEIDNLISMKMFYLNIYIQLQKSSSEVFAIKLVDLMYQGSNKLTMVEIPEPS